MSDSPTDTLDMREAEAEAKAHLAYVALVMLLFGGFALTCMNLHHWLPEGYGVVDAELSEPAPETEISEPTAYEYASNDPFPRSR